MNDKITLKQYVDYKFKNIQDTINNIINGKDTDTINLSFDNENVDLECINETADNDANNKITADDVLTDSMHRYISDIELEKLNECISKTELNTTVKEITNNFKMALNDQLDNILNNRDAINAINSIKDVISNNQESLDLFKDLVSKEEFKDHLNDGLHLSSEDRIALNLLLKFIDKGCADWNAVEGDANYIRNKPSSLPANGGNAETLGGYCVYKLMTKQSEKYIIGINTAKTYGLNEVNLLLTAKNVNKLEKYLVDFTSICIREGDYQPQNLNIGTVTLYGVGDGTQICNSNVKISNSKIRDLKFINCNITINGASGSLQNIVFENCVINLLDVNQYIIKNNIFRNCKFTMDKIYNSIIKDNIFDSTMALIYFGGGNIISDNVII